MQSKTPNKPTAPASTIEALLRHIDTFLGKNPGMTDEALGWNAAKDSSIVVRLRSGGDCTTRKLDTLIRYMSNPKRK